MDGRLLSTQELIAKQKQLAADAADVERQLLERARVDQVRAQVAELDNKQRNLPAELDKVQSSRAAEQRKIQAAHDVKCDLLATAEKHVSIAETEVEDQEIQLKAAQLNLDTLKSHVDELKSDMIVDRQQMRNALQELNEAAQLKIDSLNSIHIELAEKKKELQGLDPESDAESIQSVIPSSSRTARADAKKAGHLVEDQTAVQCATPVAETLFVKDMTTQSTCVTQAAPTRPSRSPIAGQVTSEIDTSARRSLTSTGSTDQSSLFITCDTPVRHAASPLTTSSSHPVDTSAATDGSNRKSGSNSQQAQHSASSQLPQVYGNTGDARSGSAEEPSRRPHTRNRDTVSALTDDQLALRSEYADIRAAMRGLSGSRGTIKSQSTPKAPVFAKAADEPASTDKEKRKSTGTEQKPSIINGEEVHECSLSEDFPTVVYVQELEDDEGAWCELRCFVCHANTSVDQLDFFANIKPFVQHIARSHGSFPREEVAAACVTRQFSSDDVKRLLDGKQPLKGAPIMKTFGETYRRALRLEDGLIVDPHNAPSNHSSPGQQEDPAMEETPEDTNENFRGRSSGQASNMRAFHPSVRSGRVVELGDSEDELAIPATADGPSSGPTLFHKSQSSMPVPTVGSQPQSQLQFPAEQYDVGKKAPHPMGRALTVPQMLGQSSISAANGGEGLGVHAWDAARSRRDSLLKDSDEKPVGISNTIPSARAGSGFFRPFAGGQKRTHGEMTPPKGPRRADILHPDFPATASIDGEWCAISCRMCAANADRVHEGAFKFFDGLSGLLEHIGEKHPTCRPDANDPTSFANCMQIPRSFQLNEPFLSGLRIAPHAGDRLICATKEGALPAKNINVLHPDVPTTAHFDGGWYKISCATCSANAESPTKPFWGLSGLAAHVRAVHGKETNFDDVRSWCTVSGPIGAKTVQRINGLLAEKRYSIDLIPSQVGFSMLAPTRYTPNHTSRSSNHFTRPQGEQATLPSHRAPTPPRRRRNSSSSPSYKMRRGGPDWQLYRR